MNIIWSNGNSDAALDSALPLPIDVRPMRNARRLRLRFDPAERRLKLTCPARTSRKAAIAWALDQRDWIDRQIASAGVPEPIVAGARIPLNGHDVQIVFDPHGPRTPRLDGGIISCGGTPETLGRRVLSFLRRLALETMSEEAAQYAALAGVAIRGVSVGDAGTRWGSCSADKRIRFNWRLILAPPEVRRFVVAHEVAHLVHLNHGAQFKALEARLYGPGLSEAKAKLKRLGPRIRLIGLGS